MSYASIRASSRKAHSARYANGGRTKRPGVVINVISGQPQPPAMPAPGPMGPPPPPPPPPGMNGPAGPLPPAIKNQAMGAMGGPGNMFANGGRAKCMAIGGGLPAQAGSGSGVGRLKKARNPKTQL